MLTEGTDGCSKTKTGMSLEQAISLLKTFGTEKGSTEASDTVNSHNIDVLKSATKYLSIRSVFLGQKERDADFDEKARQIRQEGRVNNRAVSEFSNLEQGLVVLYMAYQTGRKNDFICRDILEGVEAVAAFYQNKVYSAYSAACDIVFDASSLEMGSPMLRGLTTIRNSLQQLNKNWPPIPFGENLTLFWNKVNHYGSQMGIETRSLPAYKMTAASYFSRSSMENARCA